MIVPFLTSIYESGVDADALQETWPGLLEEIRTFSLSSQVYHLLKQTGQSERIPSPLYRELKAGAEKVMFHNMLVKRETLQVLRALEEDGIPAIPLKGVVFADKYFGGWQVRGTSDIDLLIRPEDRERAANCVRELGFRKEDRYHSLHYHAEYAKELPGIGRSVAVELHWNLLRKHTSHIRMERLWNEAIPLEWERLGAVHLRELPLAATFYTICLHTAKHRMISLKHVLDVAHLIYRYGAALDMEALLKRAGEDGTLGHVRAALTVAYRLFPGLQQVLAFAQPIRLPFYRESLMREAGQGVKSYRYYAYLFSFPLVTLDQWTYRRKHLLHLLLPPRDRAARTLGRRPDDAGTALGLYWRLYKHRYRVYRSHQHHPIEKRIREGSHETAAD
jgi:hypothetical protein